MRQKELRIALICYGGISLAVYMHGVTKEVWKLARASRDLHLEVPSQAGSEAIYRILLERLQEEHGLKLRVLTDILTGASAGGINAIFLAQAIHSGHSLEPLTSLWLENADVERLLDPAADLWTRIGKFWAPPLVEMLLTRPGSVVSESVAPEMRAEVRRKLARFVRSRWFEPPFSGIGFSSLLADALLAMAAAPAGPPLLPQGHPLDLFVTATDFHGHLQKLTLHSPPIVDESEHRLSLGFRSRTPAYAGEPLAALPELVLAARATASFPGAFPPLKVDEIDRLTHERGIAWPERDAFLARILPVHAAQGDLESVALIDGSVLVNAPFSQAMQVLQDRPAQREVDRRFVYIDPTPDRRRTAGHYANVGFFRAIFGSISAIPREQPIRDNLEQINAISREAADMAEIIEALRPEVEREVDQLFGRTLFLDRPTPRRLAAWRMKAQQVAAQKAGYAYHAYAEAKFASVTKHLARLLAASNPGISAEETHGIADALAKAAKANGRINLAAPRGGASREAIAFFRAHDIAYRVRRLRLLARRLSREWDDDTETSEADREAARDTVYRALALYFDRDEAAVSGSGAGMTTKEVLQNPEKMLRRLAEQRNLPELDRQAEHILCAGLQAMPPSLRRRVMLSYLGFAFYDIATLPLLRNEALTEFDPVKVDRISPDDATSIRSGGAAATLRGIEFYNFGAFFSRAYRENDYLWGRLHGAERMVDLVCSTLAEPPSQDRCAELKHALFLAILDEEEARLAADPALVASIRKEIESTAQGASISR